MTASIKSLHVRNYRSIEAASIENCGHLNVFIGKNNAGKSNLLATINLIFQHLKSKAIVSKWDTQRPRDEFTDKDPTKLLQIGVEFHLPADTCKTLRDDLNEIAPQLAKSIDQLESEKTVSFVIRGIWRPDAVFHFVENISLGPIRASESGLTTDGVPILNVPLAAALTLYRKTLRILSLQSDLRALARLGKEDRPRLENYYGQSPEQRRVASRFMLDRLASDYASDELTRRIRQLPNEAATIDQFFGKITEWTSETQENIDNLEKEELSTPIKSYSGEVKLPPPYVSRLMSGIGEIPLLHLRENKRPIGKPEAEQLLALKVKRGGPERLQIVQQTVKNLLGVDVDAFESDTRENAEMDVDQFLVEANGAGIREALRLILDLELKAPKLVLIEEPEVHLHPGLEHAVQTYLQEKSASMQLFVTTHSTNFVDAVSFQNIYLVSRTADRRTHCEKIDAGESAMRIPAELGLRLSTVFMYDRLVFVEGPSDEAVLREVAKTLAIDLTRANIGFVQMGGVRNFAHYAAEGTLDLLVRRRIKMWFVIDRDEREDADIQQMLVKLGDRAELMILGRRELENYLLDPGALLTFITAKKKHADDTTIPSLREVTDAINESAMNLKDAVIRLRVENRVLTPVYLQSRGKTGPIPERINLASNELRRRLELVPTITDEITADVEDGWNSDKANRIAPGSWILDGVCRKFKVSFSKDNGDSARLARAMKERTLHSELKELLASITD
jgi:AAA15 family ATPase/GTPase